MKTYRMSGENEYIKNIDDHATSIRDNYKDLFVSLFVYSRTSNFSAIWQLSLLPVTGLQILAYAWRSGLLSREESLSCHTYCDTGPQFIRSHPKDRHLRPTVGFETPTQGSSDHCTRRSRRLIQN
jgi:hypothetical protein